MNELKYGRIIFYGAGHEGKTLFSYIQKRNHIVAWIDKRSDSLRDMPFPVSPPNILISLASDSYDCILVAVYFEDTFLAIRSELINEYHIDEKKIHWLHGEWRPYMRKEKGKAIGTKVLHRVLPMKKGERSTTSLVNETDRRIKVRVAFAENAHLWNVIKTLCISFSQDSKCDLLVLLLGGAQSGKYNMVRKDIPNVIYYSEYNIEEDQPDIFFVMPYSRIKKEWLKSMLKYCALVCAIPIGLVRTSPYVDEHTAGFFENLNNGLHLSIFDRLQYKELLARGIRDPRIVELGNPKFDNIYNIVNSDIPAPPEWDKIKDKKTILWTTDHVWAYGNITFDLYFEYMMQYFQERREVALIFRPHPLYIKELLEEGIWSKEDLDYLRSAFACSENMVFDEYPDYSLTYRQADGILCDVNCGIILSALPLGKPLGVTVRYDEFREDAFYPDLADKLYQINDKESLYKFLDMVAAGEDPRRADREQAVSEYISHFDGKNGERIKEFVLQEYFKKTGDLG